MSFARSNVWMDASNFERTLSRPLCRLDEDTMVGARSGCGKSVWDACLALGKNPGPNTDGRLTFLSWANVPDISTEVTAYVLHSPFSLTTLTHVKNSHPFLVRIKKKPCAPLRLHLWWPV